jgi:hypothetical protein
MIVDAHAHFLTDLSGRADWRDVNYSRLRAGGLMRIDFHVASILGSWGHTSPTYFPSPTDVTHANSRLLELIAEHPETLRGYCVVNPNYTEHALGELRKCFSAGMIGVKLAASRRVTDRLLDPIAEFAAERRAPVLQHIWQRRRRDWPGQEASDAVELVNLARRHPQTIFILAHLGGGGDWSHSLRAVRRQENVIVELSGSGVDTEMLEQTIDAVGVERMLWGSDVTMDTGLAKLRYLETLGLGSGAIERLTSGTARAIFPEGSFPSR